MKFALLKKNAYYGWLEVNKYNDAQLAELAIFLQFIGADEFLYDFFLSWLEGTCDYSEQDSRCATDHCLVNINDRIYFQYSFDEPSFSQDSFSATKQEMASIIKKWCLAYCFYLKGKKTSILIKREDGEINFELTDE